METTSTQQTITTTAASPSGSGFADLVDRAELDDALAGLRAVNHQLLAALESRIAIEQAKGILAERYDLDLDEAFQLLRYAARSGRTHLHALATTITGRQITPEAVTAALARPERWARSRPLSRHQRLSV